MKVGWRFFVTVEVRVGNLPAAPNLMSALMSHVNTRRRGKGRCKNIFMTSTTMARASLVAQRYFLQAYGHCCMRMNI